MVPSKHESWAFVLMSLYTDCRVEVRDIATNPLWEDEYNMSVPVLVRAEVDGSNEVRGREE